METSNDSRDNANVATNPSASGTTDSVSFTQGYTSSDFIMKVRRVLVLMSSPITDEVGSKTSVLSGLTTIIVMGTTLGLLAAPGNQALTMPYRSLSAAIGYIYFLAWSVSFYPQVISNFKRRSTEGLSVDFVVLNVIGFGCYAAYNAAFFWNTAIQEDYRRRFGPDAKITVQSNDVAFAIHALVLSAVTFCQILYYSRSGLGRKLSKPILFIIVCIIAVCIGYPLLIFMTNKRGHDGETDGDGLGRYNWLDFLYLLSYIKIMISLIKYIPQVLLNVRRKSTVGWSIWNILLDFTGGALSDLQLVLDCANLQDFTGITHNKAKLALGSLSIVFDVIFLAQHYCIYAPGRGTNTEGNVEQTEPLLTGTEGPIETPSVIEDTEQQPEPEMIFV